MEYKPSFSDNLYADIQPSYTDVLTHHGIKGMHWGVRRYQNPDGSYTALGAAKRKQLSKIDKKYDKLAKKDAKEYARAKMSYGEGAGNRRKLIKNKVEQHRKENEHYNKVFDEYLEQEDMSKHADAAKRERTVKDAAKTTKRAAKTAVKVFNTVAPLLHGDETDAYLAHHGIKGMHWGVRRYQNPDGSLTNDGRKRYYTNDATLSKEGNDFNKKARTNFRSYRDATLYNTRAINPDFVRAEKRYKELQKANSEQYKKDSKAFLKGEDFVGLDYEDFRDKAYDRWRKTDLGKEEEQVKQDLRKMLDDSAKEHPLYSKSFKTLRYFNPNVYDKIHNIPMSKAADDFETINYGRQVVNEIMSAIETGRTDNMWD